MNKKELVRRTASMMREQDVRKPVKFPKHVFHITDDDGNKKDFVVRQTDKAVIYTVEDVEAVIDAAVEVVMNSIRQGEHVVISGFGTLGLKYRKPRKVKKPFTDIWMDVEGHYSPKFTVGKNLQICARAYEASLKEGGFNDDLPLFDDFDKYEEDGD